MEEADESVFWIEILVEAEIIEQNNVSVLMKEANEILKVTAKARKSVSEKIK